jgi:NADH-quinone oxidoreductase subunit L
MGGLRKYMKVTWLLMWIATLAIAGIPFFSGFFSKDEILASVFARSQDSALAEASLLGIPGSTLLTLVFVLALFAAVLTAVYMTRMMLYTFHGPNRTGEQERGFLTEAPWIMTGPLVVLGLLSALGGWLNVPALMEWLPGPEGLLHHWLEPVVGDASLRLVNGVEPHLDAGTERMLVLAAVAVALAGIVIALAFLRPRKLVSKVQAGPERGFAAVLANKYYVDEIYDRIFVRPTVGISRVLLWKVFDVGIIDGLVNFSATLSRGFGYIGARMQSGQVGTYAWVLILGALAILSAVVLL